ncbi:MAG: class I SAM-dependent methyltransferase [Deltaproteobacteria bacterium]|nr:class I SAM-dependent methyltransferase [Deltaproteobacteria bacterium]
MKTRSPSLAARADPHALYERAVQDPLREVRLLVRVYQDAFGATPLRLREDFCGTAAVSAAWVRGGARRQAWGVDQDRTVLEWGMRHHVAALAPAARRRIHLMRGDVRAPAPVRVDVIAAANFSFFGFHARADLRDYLCQARKNLARRGVLVLEMMGGADVQTDRRTEARRFPDFTYVWEQSLFDPITHRCDFAMHFRFRDGSVLPDAFTYAWRIWTIPDVRELLAEAGFRRSVVYWAETDRRSGGSNGVYRRREHAPPDPAWLCHVVGIT